VKIGIPKIGIPWKFREVSKRNGEKLRKHQAIAKLTQKGTEMPGTDNL